MPRGIGIGIGMSIAIVSRAVAPRAAGRLAFDESAFAPDIDPIPGMPGIVLGRVGGFGGVCDDAAVAALTASAPATNHGAGRLTAEFPERVDATRMTGAIHSATFRAKRSARNALLESRPTPP